MLPLLGLAVIAGLLGGIIGALIAIAVVLLVRKLMSPQSLE